MFSTSFGGGYQAYSQRENAVSRANKARQKSQKISQATAGKKRARKEENKGKHRDKSKSETTITSGSEKQGGSGFGVVNVISAKAPNRKGAGRPKTISGVSGVRRGLETAFGSKDTIRERGVRSEARERELEAEQRRREERLERRSAAELEQQRRDRGERQRQFNIQQQAERTREQQRQQDLAQQVAREQARDIALAQERQQERQARQAEKQEELRIREQESQARLAIEERIARQQLAPQGQQAPAVVGPLIVGPLIAEGAIVNRPQTDFSNIGNPVVNVGTDATSRRRERGRGRGGGGSRRRQPLTDSSSSSSDSSSGGDPDPTPRTRRERSAQSAQSRQRSQRSPSIPTTPAEEQSLLAQGAGALLTGATTLGGGLARAGGGFVGGIGGAIAEQLPTAETVGDIAGRGVVAVGGATGRAVASGAQTLAREALRPTQEEQQADPSLLQSVSEGESVVVEPQQPVRTLAQRNQDRIDATRREVERLRQEEDRQKRIREESRAETQRRAEQGEQAGLLADIQAGAGRVVGAVGSQVSLIAEALNPNLRRSPDRPTVSFSAQQTAQEDFSSEGEGAGQVLIRTDEPQSSFIEDYAGGQSASSGEEARLAVAPTPAQVQRDIESGTEGIFRQLERVARTGGDVLEDPVEAPLSPRVIQEQEDARAAREEQSKLDFPKERVEPKKTTGQGTSSPIPIAFRGGENPNPLLSSASSSQSSGRSGQAYQADPRFLSDTGSIPRSERDKAFLSGSESETDIKELKRIERERIYKVSLSQGKTERQARALSRMGTRYLGESSSSSSEGETSPDEEAKFRDIKSLSPKQLEKTAEQLQRQQIDADRRLAEAQREERPPINLLQEALGTTTRKESSDSGSSGGEGAGFGFGGFSEGSSGGSQGEDYNLGQYKQDDY